MKYFLFSCLILAATCRNDLPVSTNNTDTNVTHSDSVPPDKEAAKNETLAGKWQLQPVLASDTASGKIPVLDFDLSKKRVSGNTGCNSLRGSFILKDDALNFSSNMISTKMACPGYNEKAFLDNLLKTNRYEIKSGVLQLMYNTTILSKWVRHADTSINKEL
jgi:heat shock protein HslJ